MNISRYANIDKFLNIRYIFLLAHRAYSWLFQLAQMWKLLAPGVGLGDFLTPALHRCFLPSFGSFGQAVSEEKIFKNRPIRNKNCLWWPCLLLDRDKTINLYRGPSIYTSYQVSVHMVERFQRRRLNCEKLTDDGRQVMAKAHINFGKVS